MTRLSPPQRRALLHPLDLIIAGHSLVLAVVWMLIVPRWLPSLAFVALHIAAIGWIVRSRRIASTPTGEAYLAIASALWLLVAWHELAVRYAVVHPINIDPAIAHADATLTGGATWHLTLSMRWPAPWVRESFVLSYGIYFPLIFVPSILAWYQCGARAARDAFAPILGSFLVCYAIYVFVTVLGPANTGPGGLKATDALGASILAAKHAFDSLGTAFPSAHAAGATATAWAVRPYVNVWWRTIFALQAAAVGIACVYTGNHYVIDVVAGMLVAAMVCLVLIPLASRAVAAVPAPA